jgi:uncharacterized membrane protein YkoI
MRFKLGAITWLAVALFATAGVAGAQEKQATYKRELPAKLLKRARVTEDSAAVIARAKVPGGTIQGVELEEEDGKLLYSYTIKIPGKKGIEEVNINAIDGTVIAVEHERSHH